MRNSQHFLLTLMTVGMIEVTGLNFAVSASGFAVGLTTQSVSQSSTAKKTTAERLAEIFRRGPNRGGSQGEFCAIAPNPTNGYFRTSWNTQPLFVWNGDVLNLEVLNVSADPTSLWTHQLTDSEKQQRYVIYGGTPLTREDRYMLRVTYQEPGRNTPSVKDIRFEVLRNAPTIEAQLTDIGDPSTATNLTRQQEMALERALIFEEADLWMDVMRELAPIQNDGAWGSTVQDAIDKMCE